MSTETGFSLKVAETEDDAKQHLAHTEDNRDLHLERVEKWDLVFCQLPRLQPIATVY